LDVHRSTVSRAANGGALANAITDDGRIDLDHPDAIEWISEREDDDAGDIHTVLDVEKFSLDELEEMTLQAITERFGHIEQFFLHIKARREYEQAARASIQRARLEGRLIPCTTVVDAMNDYDAGGVQMLTDTAQAL